MKLLKTPAFTAKRWGWQMLAILITLLAVAAQPVPPKTSGLLGPRAQIDMNDFDISSFSPSPSATTRHRKGDASTHGEDELSNTTRVRSSVQSATETTTSVAAAPSFIKSNETADGIFFFGLLGLSMVLSILVFLLTVRLKAGSRRRRELEGQFEAARKALASDSASKASSDPGTHEDEAASSRHEGPQCQSDAKENKFNLPEITVTASPPRPSSLARDRPEEAGGSNFKGAPCHRQDSTYSSTSDSPLDKEFIAPSTRQVQSSSSNDL